MHRFTTATALLALVAMPAMAQTTGTTGTTGTTAGTTAGDIVQSTTDTAPTAAPVDPAAPSSATYPSTTTTTDQSGTTGTGTTGTGTTGYGATGTTGTGATGTGYQATTSDQGAMTGAGSASAADTGSPRAPDGSRFFGFEPYIGILGGYDSFDRREDFSTGRITRRLEGAQIEGLIGVNIPIGPVFVGVEGFGAKGFAAIDWEYGVRGRAGVRVGDSGLIYGSFGRTWVEVKDNDNRGFRNVDDWVYGLGVEVGPRDIGLGGITGSAGPRLRLSVESFDLKSIRPMAGIVFHF